MPSPPNRNGFSQRRSSRRLHVKSNALWPTTSWRLTPDLRKALVRLDPRLTSAALAHLLENAGQYSPPGSTITVKRDALVR